MNLEIDRPLRAISRRILGTEIANWSEEKAVSQCQAWDKASQQLNDMMAVNRADLDLLITGEIVPPDDTNPEQYRQNEIARLTCQLEKTIAMIERLNSIWLKLSGGGAVAMLASLQRASTMAQLSASIKEGNAERNVTQRKRFGAGAGMVIES